MNNKLLLFLVITFFLINLVAATNDITISNSPSGNQIIAGHTININSTINSINPLDTVCTNVSGTVVCEKDSSLIACYNFDNNSLIGENDTYVVDWCGGNNGTVIGGSNVSMTSNGKYNGAVNFSGNNAYIQTPNNITGVYNWTKGFTFGVWFNSANLVSGHSIVAMNPYGHANASIFKLATNGASLGYTIYLWNGSSILLNADFSQLTFSLNKWYYVTGTFNNGNATLYINGVPNNSTLITYDLPTVAEQFQVGAQFHTFSAFNGTIDEVRIWNRSLTNSEVAQQYVLSLNKFNQTRYMLYNNISVIGLSQIYGVLINDTLGNNNVSNQNIFRRQNVILGESSNGIIRSDFYGMNLPYSTNTPYDNITSSSSSCALPITSNYNLVQSSLLNLGISNYRTSAYFWGNEKVQDVFTNPDPSYDAKWAYEHNKIWTFVLTTTPEWLANKTSGWCALVGNNDSCPPTDYGLWANMSVKFLDNVTENGKYNSSVRVEIINEPDLTGWLNNATASIKSREYNKIYNATYLAIKAKYPTVQVGAIPVSDVNSLLFSAFLGNFSNQFDFISPHQYVTNANAFTGYSTMMNTINFLCSQYSANCSNIIIGEWNFAAINYNTTKQSAMISNTLGYMLNNYVNNVSMQFFGFDTPYQNNTLCDSNLGNYYIYSQFGDSKTTGYNTFLNFAHAYAPSGFSVYNSSVDYNGILSVYTKSSDGKTNNLILTNTENDQQNVSAILPSGTYIKVNDGTLYTSDGVNPVNLGVMDAYDVDYYTNPSYTYVGNAWQWQNYLGENIRPLTHGEVNTYAVRNGNVCDSNNAILDGFLVMLPIIVIFAVVFIVLGFKNGMFTDINIEKLMVVGGGILLLALMVGIGAIIVSYIGGC